MTKEELEAMGIFGVESESELAVKNPERTHEFAQKHHGMMSGSSIGLIIIEPASDAEIEAKQAEIEAKQAEIYASKTGRTATKEKELVVLQRALEKMQNGDFSQTAKSYLDEIIAQRRRVFNPERPRAFKGNAATEWGNGKELEAIAAYEALTGLKLEKTGDNQEFIWLSYVESVDFDFSKWFGCTPDSVTEENDVILVGSWSAIAGDKIFFIPREFKNPSSGVVFDRYRELKTPFDLKKENAIYYWQCIAQMRCCDAPYMQWIAYDCDIKSDNPADKFVIIDFERDLAAEKVLIDSLFKAVQYIQERV
jgi:hypothetical protein